ncbi:GAF and ANTAR domain-containing protein [Mycobacterium sp. 1274756.6]|uniref:GAF and ANTAR domain-containing protein n=1 Tax=Mycobacterium sp. 1274756.6 TaxID=1834076 RepID=UPI000800DFE6|nr:GAF and ANTAR domain-containing protein [Mycobacterium sp. 1274756.6]OBJ73089.1 response regulator receiver protein [Mycobacterium sp. 1274756.6]
MGEYAAHTDLASVLGDLALEMQGQTDPEATLKVIVEGAVALVPGARWAGVSINRRGRIESRMPSNALVAELDQAQADLGEGPCVSATREHHTVLIDDMAAESRWPRFARLALERGVHSVVAFQLFAGEENLGAMNLYSTEPGVFDRESILVGEILAQHASAAFAGALSQSQLQSALASRDLIGQAKGILMHREQLTGMQAFQLLLRTSQNANIKLVEVARWVVEKHEAGLGG